MCNFFFFFYENHNTIVYNFNIWNRYIFSKDVRKVQSTLLYKGCSFVILYISVYSEESKRRGFTAIVDSRDGSWQNLVTVLGCLQVTNLLDTKYTGLFLPPFYTSKLFHSVLNLPRHIMCFCSRIIKRKTCQF